MSQKRERPDESALADLLVILGTQRYGTDWTNVSAAIRAAIGPLESIEPPPASECEDRFRALVEGVPVELPALAAKLQARHLETLAEARAGLVKRIEELCDKLPARHPSRAAFLSSAADVMQVEPMADVEQADDAKASSAANDDEDGRQGAGRARLGVTADATPDTELEESWVTIAEEEDRHSRRASVGGTLVKMLAVVSKHKWAYPFKRPVTEKEAPDYREIITNPMDFATLKRRVETGQVADVNALVDDLNLIFDNAMKYNGEGTDYYKMAATLKSLVANQKTLYIKARGAEAEGTKGTATTAPPTVTGAVAEDADKGTGRRRGRR